MATQAFAMEAVKRKATGRDAVGVGTAVAATKAELKAQLLNSNNDEDTKEEMEKAKQVSCWDAWKFRLMFFIGAGLGAAFIGVSQARNNDRLNIMYGIFWCIWAIIAFGMNWNYASMLSLYKSANEIEETYVKTKAEVGLFARNNAEFKKENDELQKNVEELKHTEGKLSKASKVLQGEVADLKAIQVKVGEMNDRSLKTIEERESIAARQRRIILLQEKEEMEYQSEDILNRIRAYFDDAAGENNTIEKSEYKTLADHIQNIPSLKKSSFKMLKFEDYTDEYDDDVNKMEKFEMTSKLRPLLREYFENEQKALDQKEKKNAEEAKMKFAELRKKVKSQGEQSEKKFKSM